MKTKISLYVMEDLRTPKELYTLLVRAGVKCNQFRSGGDMQPIWDWLMYEGRPESLLVPPWTIYMDESDRTMVIEQ